MIEKIATFISTAILKRIRGVFQRQIQTEVTVDEDELWGLFMKYRKQGKLTSDEYIIIGAFVRFLLIKLRLRK